MKFGVSVFLSVLIGALAVVAEDQSGVKVLAAYGDKSFTFKEFAERQPNLTSWVGISAGSEQIENGLSDMIFEDLLAQEADKSGIAKDPDVQSQIRKIMKTAYLKQRVPKDSIEVTDTEINSYYKHNLDKFKSQEQVRVSHILIGSEDEAQKLRKDLKTGADWKVTAEKHSLDPLTAKRAGSFGSIPPIDLLPELREDASDLKPGEISKPIKSAFGYHLLRVDAKPKVSYRPLDEVKKDIYTDLFRSKQGDLVKGVREELWKKYHVSIKHDAIESIVRERSVANVSVDKSSLEKRLRKPGEATELEVISETVDLGRVPASRFGEMLLVGNTTDRDLTITRVGSTCPCIQVAAENMTIRAGGQVKLALKYDPDILHDTGQVQKTLFIESTDAIQPRKFVRLNLDVDRKQ